MAHFVGIDEANIVQSIHVVDNINLLNKDGVEEEDIGIEYLNKLHGTGLTWVQTSYNKHFRRIYAGIGDTYDKTNDVFIAPQLYPSWTLDASFEWQPPTVMPDDGKMYSWNEDTQAWDENEME